MTRVFAQPRAVTNLGECYFYHTLDLPGYGLAKGPWDLRDRLDEYLGGVDFRNKRVLDLGTASGFLAFSLENQASEVLAYDLSEQDAWDVVPFAGLDLKLTEMQRREHIRQINNGFWLSHKALGSNVKCAYGSIYALPAALDEVDISILGCILLHLRDPFRALQEACRVTRETVVVVERPPDLHMLVNGILGLLRLPALARLWWGKPYMQFLPSHRRRHGFDTWWRLPAATVIEFLGILGFEDTRVNYHRHTYAGSPRILYTVVGRRTRK